MKACQSNCDTYLKRFEEFSCPESVDNLYYSKFYGWKMENVIESAPTSVSYIQNKMKVSYSEAKRLFDSLGHVTKVVLNKNIIQRIAPGMVMVKKIKQRD